VRRVSGDAGTDALSKMLKSIYNRPSIASVNAIRNNNVHLVKSDLFVSLRYPVGVAYFAKWFYPKELADFDVEQIHRDLITDLYGEEEWNKIREVYVYP